MATNPIPIEAVACKATKAAYFDASCVLDEMRLDLERLCETSYALATSEAFGENAQHSFYLIGEIADRLRLKAKGNSQRYDVARGMGVDQ